MKKVQKAKKNVTIHISSIIVSTDPDMFDFKQKVNWKFASHKEHITLLGSSGLPG